jgi:hypothetical protein
MKEVNSPINRPCAEKDARGVKHAAVYVGGRNDAQRMGPGPDRPVAQRNDPDPFRVLTGRIDIVPDRER